MIRHSATARNERYALAARFEQLRNLLLTDRFLPRLKHPLAFWSVKSDRRLPRALLHRPLGDLLRTSFDSLAATPGIGHKKIQSLLTLLDRALHSDALEQERICTTSEMPAEAEWSVVPTGPGIDSADHTDPSNISEVTWAKWRAVILDRGLGDEPLGRFADTLHQLPRVIWGTPLATYAALTLAEIRTLKTHGEKRVRCVIEIFGRLHAHFTENPDGSLLDVSPKTVDDVDSWLRNALECSCRPTLEDLRLRFVAPLVEQIRVDTGDQTAELVLGRLGWEGPRLSVRRAAMKLRLTRARIYQLLEDAATVVAVRLPSGLTRMRALLEQFASLPAESAERRLLTAAAETFFPEEFRPQVVPVPAFLRRFESSPTPSAWPAAASPMRHSGYSASPAAAAGTR